MGPKIRRLAALLSGILLLLCGCAGFYEAEYIVITDHVGTEDIADSADRTYQVSTYAGMKNVLMQLVNAGAEHGTLRASKYSGSVSDDIARACLEVSRESPLGSYAVEYMTHSISRILSYYEVDIHINYRLSQEEIDQVRSVSTLSEMYHLVDEGLKSGSEHLAVQVVTTAVAERTLLNYVESFYRENPEDLISQPGVEVVFYPSENHVQKIIEFRFDYRNSQELLQEMLAELNEKADTLTRDFQDFPAAEAAMHCVSALKGCIETPARGKTAYSALVDGSAGSEGCAMAYQLLCSLCSVPCQVVSGRLDGSVHYWNIITLGQYAYHVDPYACIRGDLEDGFLLSDSTLPGNYWWEPDRYPACQDILYREQFLNHYRAGDFHVP